MFVSCYLVFGMMMLFGANIQRKIRELNENYKTNRSDARVRREFLRTIRFYLEIKELNSFIF